MSPICPIVAPTTARHRPASAGGAGTSKAPADIAGATTGA